MTDLVFRDPPPPKKVRRNWSDIAEQLKANPGRWALITSAPKRTSIAMITTRIQRNTYGPFSPVGAFEAVSRESLDEPGRFEVFARYVGNRDGLS